MASVGVMCTLEFRESDVLPGQTEVKQGKFVEFISRAKGCFRETYKTQSIKPISNTTQGCVQSQSVCFYVSLYFFPLNLICNMTTFRYILPFNPTLRLRVCLRSEYVLALCSILNSL